MKVYDLHENIYGRMKKEGLRCWNQTQCGSRDDIDADAKEFLDGIFLQHWCPPSGKVIELGCGSGPILRMVCEKGFSGVGADVSKTAIEMAKEQSAGLDIRFKRVDVCREIKGVGKFDIVIDGHCLHCITEQADRDAFLKNAYDLLKKDGIFIVMTMCSPIDKPAFSRSFPNQKFLNNCIYVPSDCKDEIVGQRIIKSIRYIPTRKVKHWKNVLLKVEQAGFKVRLFTHYAANDQGPCGSAFIAASKRERQQG